MKRRIRLGVNIDHIATVRQARRGTFPDPVEAALLCEKAGADHIVCHLREDRRHIQDEDVRRLMKSLRTHLDLEMSLSPEIVAIAKRLRPRVVTFVPEKRKELTTEGGLDVLKFSRRLSGIIRQFRKEGIAVSLFIDPTRVQVEAAAKVGARRVELHTGRYANAPRGSKQRVKELAFLYFSTRHAKTLGLRVAAGHGLDYENVRLIAKLPGVEELNIGYSIITRALFVGIEQAVRKMRRLIP